MRKVQILDHVILLLGVFFMVTPVALAFMTSTHDAITIYKEGIQFLPGDKFLENYETVLFRAGGFTKEVDGFVMLMNSMILGFGFAIGKIIVSMLAAYAIVYFRFPLGTLCFWIIFSTLLLPLDPA